MLILRSWSRRAWFLHGYLITALFLMGPVPPAKSYWTDANNDGQKEWVEDPASWDSWWAEDSDGDYLSNNDEVLFGSDPYRMDADFDGLTDLVEYQYGNSLPLDPWNWDSDSDGFSDHDEYYAVIQSYTPVVHYPSLGGNFFSYYDADGDGLQNQDDPDPVNTDRDGDSIPNWQDNYPDDPANGMPSPDPDSDGDGSPDSVDPFPYGSFWYNGFEYGGSFIDNDNDTIPDVADPFPNGSYFYNNVEYGGYWNDQDGDQIPDPADPWPETAGSYWYNNVEYAGYFTDQDGDSIPDPADPFPSLYGSYWWQGTEYGGQMQDSDADGIPDFADTDNGGGGPGPDSDGDGLPDSSDPFPNGSYWYNGIEYGGYWSDTDGDSIPDPLDGYPNGSYWYNGFEYGGQWVDNDEDGIPNEHDLYPDDRWNGAPHFTYNGIEYPGEWSDRDDDGIPDPADAWPDDPENNADNDDDGISNYLERTVFYTDQNDVDTDDDFLSDHEEIYIFHTDPLQAITGAGEGQTVVDGYLFLGQDADQDGLPDLLEDYYGPYGMDRNNPDDAALDYDSDGYTNLQAYHYGWSLTAHLAVYDQDGDRIPDVLEDSWSAVYPGILSSGDFADAVEDPDQDGVMNFEEIRYCLDPGNAHSRAGSVTDLQEVVWREILLNSINPLGMPERFFSDPVPSEWQVTADADENGVPDGLDAFAAALAANGNLVTLPQRSSAGDCDGDGMPDAWEHFYSLAPRNANDASLNNDGDSLVNQDEYVQNRNPQVQDDPALEITTYSLPNGAVDATYAVTVGVSGGLAPYTFSYSENLPDGLSLDSGSGLISGVPLAGGSWNFTVYVTDQAGASVARSLGIGVDGGGGGGELQFVTTSLPEASLNVPYEVSISVSGGTGPYAFSLDAPPSNMGISSTGVFSGVPSEVGEWDLPIHVTDSSNPPKSASQSLHLSITHRVLEIADTGLPTGTVGYDYSFGITARNGAAPYHFVQINQPGETGLPYGYFVQSDGRVTGFGDTSTGSQFAGTYTFTVQVTDNAGQTAEKQLSITLEETGGTGLFFVNTWLSGAMVGWQYEGQLQAVGSGALTFSALGMPEWLALAPNGVFSGVPTQPGVYQFDVTVQDEVFDFSTATYRKITSPVTLTVGPHQPAQITILSGDLQVAAAGDFLTELAVLLTHPGTGAPLAGLPVSFDGQQVVTDSEGIARTMWSCPTSPGGFSVPVEAGGAQVIFYAHAMAPAVPPSTPAITVTGNSFVPAAGDPTSSPHPIADAQVEFRALSTSSGTAEAHSSTHYYAWTQGHPRLLQEIASWGSSASRSGTKWATSDPAVSQEDNDDPPPSLGDLDWSPGLAGRAWLQEPPDGPTSQVIGLDVGGGTSPPAYDYVESGTYGSVKDLRDEGRFEVRLTRDPGDTEMAAVSKSFVLIRTRENGQEAPTVTADIRTLTIPPGAPNSPPLTVAATQNGETAHLVLADVQVNNTAMVNDDIVRMEQIFESEAWRQWIPCTVTVPKAAEAGTTSIGVTAEAGEMRFAENGETPPVDATEGSANLNVPLDQAGVAKFWITGVYQSSEKGDAKLLIRKNGTGDVLQTKKMTVFWFEEQEIVFSGDTASGASAQVAEGLIFGGTAGLRLKAPRLTFDGKAVIAPGGLDTSVPQISEWELGFVQNVMQRTDTDYAAPPTVRSVDWDPISFPELNERKYRKMKRRICAKIEAPAWDAAYVGTGVPFTPKYEGPFILGFQPKGKFNEDGEASYVGGDEPSSRSPSNERATHYDGRTPAHQIYWPWIKHETNGRYDIWLGIARRNGERKDFVPILQTSWFFNAACTKNGDDLVPEGGTTVGTPHEISDVPVIAEPMAINEINKPRDWNYGDDGVGEEVLPIVEP